MVAVTLSSLCEPAVKVAELEDGDEDDDEEENSKAFPASRGVDDEVDQAQNGSLQVFNGHCAK